MNFRFSWLILCLTIVACNEPTIDITKPTIVVSSVSPNPINGLVCGNMEDHVIYLQSTNSVVFDLVFSDDQALSQYKIDIHNNFDCHGHRGPSTTDWNLQKIEMLDGVQQSIQEVLMVPDDVTAGAYHCSVQVLDESGNQTPTTIYTLLIQNSSDTILPTLNLTQPSTTSTTLNRGSVLTVQGNLMDNRNLEHGRIELIYFTPSGNKSTAATISLDNSVSNNYAYTFNFTIPSSFVNGRYDFEVRAYDGVGNRATSIDFEVNVQ
ncbi:DUF4625 domain-containing protein [Aureispira anguillae]|uniref:DUF4625 domain-containing protein n=1 Tax=Aureispira anguillae TaxID=2864201 RepID=A0A915YC97_9BACT|nr:DUF4625 domain-containing protein [Aureispira anguillae]BDS10411.1 DUF4625 domain-containing protein [Aureispira anguillae]